MYSIGSNSIAIEFLVVADDEIEPAKRKDSGQTIRYMSCSTVHCVRPWIGSIFVCHRNGRTVIDRWPCYYCYYYCSTGWLSTIFWNAKHEAIFIYGSKATVRFNHFRVCVRLRLTYVCGKFCVFWKEQPTEAGYTIYFLSIETTSRSLFCVCVFFSLFYTTCRSLLNGSIFHFELLSDYSLKHAAFRLEWHKAMFHVAVGCCKSIEFRLKRNTSKTRTMEK